MRRRMICWRRTSWSRGRTEWRTIWGRIWTRVMRKVRGVVDVYGCCEDGEDEWWIYLGVSG
jgi:hypothetical protein